MVLGNIAILLGGGYLGSVLTSDDGKEVPIIGGMLSSAAKFVKDHSKDGKGTSSSGDQQTAQLMSQVSRLREEIKGLGPRQVVYTNGRSGPGAFTITAVVVAGVIVYGYIKWKGWKISDMMWVTKRGLSDACNVVGNQLNEVSDTVHVTKKHLAGRIDRVDINLDETQEIIEGTRDEVAVIHVNLGVFQKELQEVNRAVEIWGSKLQSIEHTQDRTVLATEALVEFGQQMEHGQNTNIRKPTLFIPPAIGPSSEQIVRRASPLPLSPPVAESSSRDKAEVEAPQLVKQNHPLPNEASSPTESSTSSSSRLGGLSRLTSFLRSSAKQA